MHHWSDYSTIYHNITGNSKNYSLSPSHTPMPDLGDGKVVAVVMAFAISLVCLLWQLARIFKYKHNPKCVQSAFLSLCSLWCICRVAYFSIYLAGGMREVRTSWLLSLLFLLPVVFQFATFSLLVLFYVSIVNEEMWQREYRRAFETAWWLVNGGVVLLCAAELIVQVLDYYSDAFELAQLGFTGMVVGVLVVLLGYYGTKLVRLTSSTLKNRLFSGMRLTRGKVLTITFLLLAIYFSRFTYDVMALLDPVYRTEIVSPRYVGGMPNQSFILMLLWEILPIMIVLVVFRVPTSGLGFDKQGMFPDETNPPLLRAEAGPRRSLSHHYHSQTHSATASRALARGDTITTQPRANENGLFSDEKRYDSDGEQTPGPGRSLHFVFGGEFSPGMPSSVADRARGMVRDPDGSVTLPEPFETTTPQHSSAHPAPVSMWGGFGSKKSQSRAQTLQDVNSMPRDDSIEDMETQPATDRQVLNPGTSTSVSGLEPI